ncbi:MAG: hypothetical protein D6753_05285 [Planctomycetota bacterium]|nr:MAG: hypothetical protein D6753_05285 [Planctomycetota bacterium]
MLHLNPPPITLRSSQRSIADLIPWGERCVRALFLFVATILPGLAMAWPAVCRAQSVLPGDAASVAEAQVGAQEIEFLGGTLHLVRVGTDLFSGAAPVSDEDYEQLDSLGIQTVVCVDASGSSRSEALRRGWKYAHIPFSYDGIRPSHAVQIAYVLAHFPKPIYIHCHHGQHRAPAALALGAIATGRLTNDAALSLLRMAGTGRDYVGLWQCIATAQPMPGFPSEMAIPERVEPQPLQTTMLQLEAHMEVLEARRPATARQDLHTPQHPGNASPEAPTVEPQWNPTARALLVYEHLRELRQGGELPFPGYPARLQEAIEAADQLYRTCQQSPQDIAGKIQAVRARCDACHQHRR